MFCGNLFETVWIALKKRRMPDKMAGFVQTSFQNFEASLLLPLAIMKEYKSRSKEEVRVMDVCN